MGITKKRLLFIYLNSFSSTGGIEKFNACLMKSLYENSQTITFDYQAISFLDTETQSAYLPPPLLKGFGGKYLQAVLYSLWAIGKAEVVVLGHINLLVLALWTLVFPQKKVVLVAHGIEVWQNLAWWKRKVLQRLHLILAVSQYTKQRMAAKHEINLENIQVFHNTLNPFFDLPKQFDKSVALQQRYHLKPETKVLLTLARLSNAEQYKGYDTVIKALPLLLKTQPNLLYLVVGKYDTKEYDRLQILITELSLTNYVKIVGFVKDEELVAHYLLADVFVMPSKGEGFGIVYLEAMACGVPVVAGNADGSVDALQNGKLGTLVNPDSVEELAATLATQLAQPLQIDTRQKIQQTLLQEFGFQQFKRHTAKWLKQIL